MAHHKEICRNVGQQQQTKNDWKHEKGAQKIVGGNAAENATSGGKKHLKIY